MTEPRTNAFGQPIGPALLTWAAPPRPDGSPLSGRWSRVVSLDPTSHAGPLFHAFAADTDGSLWTYLPWGPFGSADEFERMAGLAAESADPLFYAVIDDADGAPAGLVAYLRIDPPAGSIEIGGITFSPRAQRTRVASEAIFLLADHAFDLGYRRLEWKCDALNAASVRAAHRYGFTPEGIFRQATVYKGRSRDTAWFAIIDRDWPRLRAAYVRWLDPTNFDDRGVQRCRLSDLTRGASSASS
jgi:RimJ/RimL family protein N-acetyltransferase